MLQPGRGPDRGPARDEHEADREPLGDVVHGDRDRDEDPERLASAERGADTDSLGDRMDGHHADDQERLDGVVAAQRAELVVVWGACRNRDATTMKTTPASDAEQPSSTRCDRPPGGRGWRSRPA